MANSHHHHPSEQDIEQGKYDAGAAEFSAESGPSLPEGYGDNRIVIMARDPFWFFAYWEISADKAESMRVQHGRNVWDETVMTLRVYDLGESSQTSPENASFFDVDLPKFSRQYYVQVPQAGHVYLVDLGLRWADGRFASLFRSNVIRQPSGRVSDRMDSEWMSVDMHTREWELMAMRALGLGGSKGASGELAKGMELRWEYLRSVFSGSTSSWMGKDRS